MFHTRAGARYVLDIVCIHQFVCIHILFVCSICIPWNIHFCTHRRAQIRNRWRNVFLIMCKSLFFITLFDLPFVTSQWMWRWKPHPAKRHEGQIEVSHSFMCTTWLTRLIHVRDTVCNRLQDARVQLLQIFFKTIMAYELNYRTTSCLYRKKKNQVVTNCLTALTQYTYTSICGKG